MAHAKFIEVLNLTLANNSQIFRIGLNVFIHYHICKIVDQIVEFIFFSFYDFLY